MMRAGAADEQQELDVTLLLVVGRRARKGPTMAWWALHAASLIAFQVTQKSCLRER